MQLKTLALSFIACVAITSNINAQTIPGYVPASGLKGWWPFNGNANDESSMGNNATVSGPTLVSDRHSYANKAYTFNGGTDFMSVPNSTSLSIQNDLSISFWINPASSSLGYIIDRDMCYANPDWGLFWDGSQVVFRSGVSGSDQVIYSDTMTLNSWHHIVLTRTGNLFKLYAEGLAVSSLNMSSSSFTNTSLPVYFGDAVCNALTTSPNYNGILDDIGMWNRALTQTEITGLFEACDLAATVQPASQTKAIGNNVQFTTASSSGSTVYQWQTDLGVGFQDLTNAGQYSGVTTATLTVALLTSSNNNQQFRCLMRSGTCKDTTDVAVLTVKESNGVNSTLQGAFSVYPNPAHNYIQITAANDFHNTPYKLYDAIGRLVSSGKLISGNATIRLDGVATGLYLLRIGNDATKAFSIVKE